MYEKGYYARPMFTSRNLASRPLSEATEMYDTEFEEDLSDVDDYAGRTSEDSVSIRYSTESTGRADLISSLVNEV